VQPSSRGRRAHPRATCSAQSEIVFRHPSTFGAALLDDVIHTRIVFDLTGAKAKECRNNPSPHMPGTRFWRDQKLLEAPQLQHLTRSGCVGGRRQVGSGSVCSSDMLVCAPVSKRLCLDVIALLTIASPCVRSTRVRGASFEDQVPARFLK